MISAKDLQKRARKNLKKLEVLRADPRFSHSIGKLVHLKLLDAPGYQAYRQTVFLNEMLFAGEIEPRVYELLPALLLKRPKAVAITGTLPEDLQQVLRELRRNKAITDFRGIPARDYAKWVERVGRKGKVPTLTKTFRFTRSDLECLERIKKKVRGHSETEILREALRRYEKEIK